MSQNYRIGSWAWSLAGLVGLSAAASAQSYQLAQNQIPSGSFNSSRSENVDFGDVDLDGDFDTVMADGGDCCNDQNRIWINQGGQQGGTIGFFVDETATQFPAVLDQGRDVEFVDFDNDGDLDIYNSNTSQTNNQTNRWWTNQGGIQAGTAGFYVDETQPRWLGLNSANSSISAGQLLGGGGFIDFSCDCDFADLDNDGDIDLVHSSYGGAFGGQIPTRLFLNDGLGFFTEHNPSGFKLTGQLIANGNPAIWVEGTHQSNTNNSTGVNADVASSALDIDVGDVDGDFDFDILHGARQEAPRFFKSRLAETGNLIWRDVTSAVYPAGYTSGNGHYEQEFGDIDSDNDLDIYGLNWFNNFTDETLLNTGGTFGNLTTLPSSQSDDNEGDFGDYDNDGDLDLYVCNFSGQDKLYRNNLVENGTFSYSTAQNQIPGGLNQIGLDADFNDIDNDGDYDILVGNDGNAANRLLLNITQVADTHAPRVVNLEQAPNRVSGPTPTVVRTHVYDNAAYYVTWYNPTNVEYRIDGGSWIAIPAQSSQGQIFRGEIPGQVIGTIDYRFTSSDRYGNTTTSASKTYVASNGGGCNGNTSTYCTSKPSSIPGCTASIVFSGIPSATAGSGFLVETTPAPGAKTGLFIYTTNGALGTPLQNAYGFICVASPFFRIAGQSSGGTNGACDGKYSLDFNQFFQTQVINPNLVAGAQVDIQAWARDPSNPGGANLSNTGRFTVCP